jgi:hypothetical protein
MASHSTGHYGGGGRPRGAPPVSRSAALSLLSLSPSSAMARVAKARAHNSLFRSRVLASAMPCAMSTTCSRRTTPVFGVRTIGNGRSSLRAGVR